MFAREEGAEDGDRIRTKKKSDTEFMHHLQHLENNLLGSSHVYSSRVQTAEMRSASS